MPSNETIQTDLKNIFDERRDVYNYIRSNSKLKSALLKYKINNSELLSILRDKEFKQDCHAISTKYGTKLNKIFEEYNSSDVIKISNIVDDLDSLNDKEKLVFVLFCGAASKDNAFPLSDKEIETLVINTLKRVSARIKHEVKKDEAGAHDNPAATSSDDEEIIAENNIKEWIKQKRFLNLKLKKFHDNITEALDVDGDWLYLRLLMVEFKKFIKKYIVHKDKIDDTITETFDKNEKSSLAGSIKNMKAIIEEDVVQNVLKEFQNKDEDFFGDFLKSMDKLVS